MPKTPLHRALGLLKYNTLDCWPYIFQQKQAARTREDWRQKVGDLPMICGGGPSGAEVHMLCGNAHLDMGILASWSLLRFLGDTPLYVYSDGTLSDDDFALWRSVIPAAVMVTQEEGAARVSSTIANRFPRLYSWWKRDWCGTHVVGMHLFGEARKLIVMDADVLCFKEPTALLEDIRHEGPIHRWNRDVCTSYSADAVMLNSITGLSLPEELNAGFQLTSRYTEKEFAHLEAMLVLLEEDGRVDPDHLWSSQTYCAMCAAICPDARPFPSSYAVTLGKTREDAIIRHYVGIHSVRPRFFNEGLPRLLG